MCIDGIKVRHRGTWGTSLLDMHGTIMERYTFVYPSHKNDAQLHEIYVIIMYKLCNSQPSKNTLNHIKTRQPKQSTYICTHDERRTQETLWYTCVMYLSAISHMYHGTETLICGQHVRCM